MNGLKPNTLVEAEVSNTYNVMNLCHKTNFNVKYYNNYTKMEISLGSAVGSA